MNVLLFGGSGQLGTEIIPRAHDLNFNIIAPVTSEVDVSHRDQVLFLAKQTKADVIINCAAYTAVDKAESDKERAYAVNEMGARNIAEAAAETKAFVVHISTDYVFDGLLGRSLLENDATHPVNVYGASKLAAEIALQEMIPGHSVILRTASLHGRRGENFVHTMLRLFRDRPSVQVVNDQYMSPTWAGWLAEVTLDVARLRPTGILHAAGSGRVSWFTFAQAIYSHSRDNLLKGKQVEILPTTAAAFKRAARRPVDSSLDTTALAKLLRRPSLPWEEGLKRHLSELKAIP